MLGRATHALAALAALVVLLSGCGSAAARGGTRVHAHADPVPAGSTVAFYGDSLTFGLGASSPAHRWSSVLCAERGWTEVNPSIPGLGFVKAREGHDLPAQIIEAKPQLVIVALGHNDLLLVDERGAEVKAAIDSDLLRLRRGLPDARIVVLALFSPLSFEPAQVTTVNSWLRSAAGEAGAFFVPKSSGWLVGHTDWTVDGIHFSDVGNAGVAELIDAELRRVVF